MENRIHWCEIIRRHLSLMLCGVQMNIKINPKIIMQNPSAHFLPANSSTNSEKINVYNETMRKLLTKLRCIKNTPKKA